MQTITEFYYDPEFKFSELTQTKVASQKQKRKKTTRAVCSHWSKDGRLANTVQ
jgi:hypothetical protein